MQLRKALQSILFIASIGIITLYADDGSEFNIIPDSPLDADFFDSDIPASYLTSEADKQSADSQKQDRYAIIESGPTAQLEKDEVYISKISALHDMSGNQQITSIHENNASNEVYAAAGTFVDENGEVLIPENLISIAPIPDNNNISTQPVEKPNHTIPATETTGEFISDETGGVTADVAPEDKFTVLPKGTFSMGYQLMYMNFTEGHNSSNAIYNGITASYTYQGIENILLKISSSILGAKVFNKNNGSIYSDTELVIGKTFKLKEYDLNITPYTGVGLRYMNNVFASSDTVERNTLQLYLPIGIELQYKANSKFSLFSAIEGAAIALNQNWTTYTNNTDNTSNPFCGLSAKVNLGIEYRSNTATFGLSPYYQYIYTGKKSSSTVGTTDTHIAGLNAYIKF